MAKYRVVKRIDYGGKAYCPPDYWGFEPKTGQLIKPSKSTIPSGNDGKPIAIDVSGVIELPDEIASELTVGQIAPLDDPRRPDTSAYDNLAAGVQKTQEMKGIEDKIEGPGGREAWVEGAKRAVNPVPDTGTLRVEGK